MSKEQMVSEFFFGADIQLVKKLVWSMITIMTLFIHPAIFAVTVLLVTGIYYKIGGTSESKEYVKYVFGFIGAILLFFLFPILVVAAFS
jgi:hypothetical protein